MHDLDRTMTELEEDMEVDDMEMDDTEVDDESEDSEFEDQDDEYGDEQEEFDEGDEETYGYEFNSEDSFSGGEELELAEELLDVQNDAELDQFLGKLFRRAGRRLRKFGGRARRFARSRAGRFLRKGLRKIAKRVLPIAGRAVGGAFGGPAGSIAGGFGGKALGKAFGLELEGMSTEDQELEVAKRVVRMAGAAVKNGAVAPPNVPPLTIAKKAIMKAAAKHAPGLIKSSVRGSLREGYTGRKRSQGRWFRRGNRIILIGA